MAIKFEKIQPGMMLFDVHSERAGNTTMKRWGDWPVRVISVDADSKSAMVSWNGNEPTRRYHHRLRKLYAKVPPKLAEKIADSNRPWGR
jgi:hypothetical protein